jgi:hypothetical protein
VYGPESGRGALPENEGKDPGKKQIPEEVGCCLQESVLPCKSGMAKNEPLQECSDPKKVRTAERIGHHTQEGAPPCKSGKAQEEHSQKKVYQGQCGTINPDRTDIQEENHQENWRTDKKTPVTTQNYGKR